LILSAIGFWPVPKKRNPASKPGFAILADDQGYDVIIDGIKRTYRDQLEIAQEAAQYFKRQSPQCNVSIYDRRNKVSVPVDPG
jgi:hypothetical protein